MECQHTAVIQEFSRVRFLVNGDEGLASAKNISTHQCNSTRLNLLPYSQEIVNALTQSVPVMSKCSHVYVDCCWIWSCCPLRIRKEERN